MVWPGASNIDDGITIDLGRMAGVTYDPKTEIASLLPGGKWADTYMELEKRACTYQPLSFASIKAQSNLDIPISRREDDCWWA